MSTEPRDHADGVEPLPRDAVLAHVGLPKTGTTALQAILARQRPALHEHGTLYPGPGRQHHRAAVALTRTPWGPVGIDAPPPSGEAWDRLSAEVGRARGRVVVSSEFFNDTRGADLQRFAEDLGGPRLHVVISVRHIGSVASSVWQETLKRSRVSSFDAWLKRAYLGGRTNPTPRSFWGRYAHGETIERWAALVGPDHVHVIVVDPQDRTLQQRVLEKLLDLPTGLLADVIPTSSNRSMTAAEAEAVRLANVMLRDKLSWTLYERIVYRGAIKRMVEQRRPDPGEPPIHVPSWVYDTAHEEGLLAAQRIRAAGVHVYGDLDLLASPRSASTADADPAPSDPAAAPILAMAHAIVGATAGALHSRPTLDAKTELPESGLIVTASSRTLLRVVGRRAALRARKALHR